MDERFFFDAMKHVGLKVVVIDEDTVMTNAENGETKVEVLSKATYTARKAYDCVLCHKPISLGSHYVRVVVKPIGDKVQTQRWCLPCWLG
jgi:hypothetical protein